MYIAAIHVNKRQWNATCICLIIMKLGWRESLKKKEVLIKLKVLPSVATDL